MADQLKVPLLAVQPDCEKVTLSVPDTFVPDENVPVMVCDTGEPVEVRLKLPLVTESGVVRVTVTRPAAVHPDPVPRQPNEYWVMPLPLIVMVIVLSCAVVPAQEPS